VVGETVYGLEGETLYPNSAAKDKQKSSELYISTLHADLFQTPVPPEKLTGLSEVRIATGDKQLVDELILNEFTNTNGVSIPTNQEMRSDVEGFINETSVRFFLREPNAYEMHELKQAILEDQDLTPVLIYQAFALSNEYKFY